MDKGTKRKRDSSIPTLVFSAPGYNRFAKLFKETSLDEIKEIVRKRLELSSASDFTLFYDTDIALVNDDDFDAFQVHADSAGHAVDVVVKVLAQTQSTTNVAGSSETAEPTAPDDGARGTSPPRKKRKVAADAPDAPPTAPISSAPRRKKRKGDTMPIEKDSVSSTSVTPEVASKPVETPNDAQQQQPKKKRKNPAAKNLDSTLPNASIPMSGPGDTPGANPVSDPPAPAQERPKKKSKKATEKDAVPKPTAPANVPGSASSTNEIAEPHVDDEDQRKAKTKKAPERGLDNVPPKSSASKKSTKKSKKDIQTEDVPSARNPAHSTAKSVKFAFPDSGFPNQLAQAISTLAGEEGSTPQERQKNPSTEKAKKPSKGKKKVVEQGLEDVDSPELVEPQQAAPDPEAVKEFLKSLVDKLPAAPVPAAEVATDKAAAKATKKLASSSRRDKQTSTTSCPVCQTSPVHLRYRCPIVLAGSGPIRKRIAELQQDDTTDHSQLIQELRGFAEKSQKSSHTKDLQNVNAHSPILRPHAKNGGVSNPSVKIPGHGLAASGTGPGDDDDSSSSDDPEFGLSTTRKIVPPTLPADSCGDAELDAIIRGPVSSRLTVDDIVFEEEQDEEAESVVLENDDNSDPNLRRRFRKTHVVASSDEEDEDEDDVNSEADAVAKAQPLPVINISVRANSRRSSTRSATEPLVAIAARQSVEIDAAGDLAVNDAMVSDHSLETPIVVEGGENPDNFELPPNQSARITPVPPTPEGAPTTKPSSDALRLRTPEPTTTAVEGIDDPIQPAEGFPPTPVQQNRVTHPNTPSTPTIAKRMKDRNGKLPMKLSQLDLPFSLNPQTQSTQAESAHSDDLPKSQVVEDGVSQRTRTRSSTRLLSVAAIPPAAPSEVQQPAKRRRAPNKTPEQRAQEAAAKLAAKEEKERLRKEKSQAKVEKKSTKPVGKGVTDSECPPTGSAKTTPPPTPLLDSANTGLSTPMPLPPPTSRTPMSQDEWTVLKSTSPHEEEYRDQESMRDELHSSSSEPTNGGDREEEAPLFYPAESQVPFPYSQWNSVPEELCPGSPKDSEDEDDEEEVAASIKSSQRPTNASTGSYRRLTDIASQPSLFSTPNLRAAAFPPATFPRAKNKRAELYGTLPPEDDDSTDSDSSAGDVPSHIPKSRRAGMRSH